jgi:hypothetical protein
MKKTVQFLLVMALVVIGVSCKKINADGPTITQTLDHKNFNYVVSEVDAIVTYTQAPEYHVEISAQRAILDKMKSSVSNGELRFYYPNSINIGRHDEINIRITGPSVRGFEIHGSGEIRGGDVQVADEIVNVEINGSGSAYFTNVKAEAINAKVNGSGKMTVASGSVDREYCDISGSGDIDFLNLSANDVTAHISGSGSIYTTATRTLDAEISGSGHVYYRGTPKVTTSISGSGKVQPH